MIIHGITTKVTNFIFNTQKLIYNCQRRTFHGLRRYCCLCAHNHWHKHVATIIGTNMWPQSLAQTCGHNHWHKHVATIIGTNMWPQSLAQTCGHNHWHKHVATIIGTNMGPQSLAQTCGHNHWHKHGATIIGTNMWPQSLAQTWGPQSHGTLTLKTTMNQTTKKISFFRNIDVSEVVHKLRRTMDDKHISNRSQGKVMWQR